VSQSSWDLLEEGIRRQKAGFRAHAARLYRRVPEGDPYYADALNLLATVRFAEDRLDEADRLTRQAVGLSPGNAAAWTNRGGVANRMGRVSLAVASYRRAVLLAPERIDGVFGYCGVCGPPERSVRLRWARAIAPLHQDVGVETGNDRMEAGDLAAAADWFRRCLIARPAASTPLFNLGNACRDLGGLADADRLYRWTLCVRPRSGNVLNNRGLLAFAQGHWDQAAAQFAAATRGDPGLPAAWLNLARATTQAGNDGDPLPGYRHGLILDPANRNALCELAGILNASHWVDRARCVDPWSSVPYNRMALLSIQNPGRAGVRDWLARAAVIEPGDADSWYNIGVECGRAGDVEGAASFGGRAVRVNPRHALARFNQALALLTLERFSDGWRAHCDRFDTPEAAQVQRFFTIPQWTSQAIAGRHLLLWGEQGIGDEVQFLTLLPHLRRIDTDLTVLTEPRLRPLVRRSFPGVAVPDVDPPTGALEDHHGAELHLALGDLPHRLDLFCGGAAAPTPWIVPDRDRVRDLRSGLLDRHPGQVLVGITWRSIAPKTGWRRTIAPELWRELAGTPGVSFISLQYGLESGELDAFQAGAGFRPDAGHGVEPLDDLDGLAALVSAVDLVVCPTNNTVHFAGALGKPCWVLLPTRADWRWGLRRADSLWYPRARVYRQDRDDEWRPVMQRVASDLRGWIPEPGAGAASPANPSSVQHLIADELSG